GFAATAAVLLALAVGGGVSRWLWTKVGAYPVSKIPSVNALVDEGNYSVRGNLTDAGISNAVACFTKAIELDPTFVPAHFGLWWASKRWDMAHDRTNSPDRAVLAARLARLAPGSAEALIASSELKWWGRWDFRGALDDALLATRRRASSKEAECGAHFYY